MILAGVVTVAPISKPASQVSAGPSQNALARREYAAASRLRSVETQTNPRSQFYDCRALLEAQKAQVDPVAWILFGARHFLWCERGHDFLEARIAAERVPEGEQL